LSTLEQYAQLPAGNSETAAVVKLHAGKGKGFQSTNRTLLLLLLPLLVRTLVVVCVAST
jgi:hypothetical protein